MEVQGSNGICIRRVEGEAGSEDFERINGGREIRLNGLHEEFLAVWHLKVLFLAFFGVWGSIRLRWKEGAVQTS